jgi:hypothetical protein
MENKKTLLYTFIFMIFNLIPSLRAQAAWSEIFSLSQNPPAKVIDISWPPPRVMTVSETYQKSTNHVTGRVDERYDRSTTHYLTSSSHPLSFASYKLDPQLINEISESRNRENSSTTHKQSVNYNLPVSTSADWVKHHISKSPFDTSGEHSMSSTEKRTEFIPTPEDRKRWKDAFLRNMDQHYNSNTPKIQEPSDTGKQVQVLSKAAANGYNHTHPDHRLSDVPVRDEYTTNNPDALSKQQGTGSCRMVHKTLRAPVLNDESESKLLDECLSNPNDRSLNCVLLISKQAVAAYSTEPACKDRVTEKKLMCIFEREVKIANGVFNNPCVRNGCGMAQMTGEDGGGGVEVVRRATAIYKLDYGFDSFWDMINIPEMKKNKCTLTRRDALDRNTSIIMAATHLCAQAKHSPKASGQFLSCEYQRGLSVCKANGGNTDYSRGIESCENKTQWSLTLANYDVSTRAACALNNNCESIKKGKVFQKTSADFFGPSDDLNHSGAQ